MPAGARQLAAVAALSCAPVLVAACGDNQVCKVDRTYHPTLDPARFGAVVDHPFFPLEPGTVTTFDGGGEHVEVTVTADTRTILGITATVVRDTVTVGGALTEDTYDWYAQDLEGNVWYLGEDTAEYEGGEVVSREGSWEAGVDGAQPGVVMLAQPSVTSPPYRQEYYACHAEDRAEVIGTDEAVTVPAGAYTGCVEIRERTDLEPDVDEEKVYCAGVGLVLELDVATGARTELASVTR